MLEREQAICVGSPNPYVYASWSGKSLMGLVHLAILNE